MAMMALRNGNCSTGAAPLEALEAEEEAAETEAVEEARVVFPEDSELVAEGEADVETRGWVSRTTSRRKFGERQVPLAHCVF